MSWHQCCVQSSLWQCATTSLSVISDESILTGHMTALLHFLTRRSFLRNVGQAIPAKKQELHWTDHLQLSKCIISHWVDTVDTIIIYNSLDNHTGCSLSAGCNTFFGNLVGPVVKCSASNGFNIACLLSVEKKSDQMFV